MTRYLSELVFAPQAFAAFIKNPQDRAQPSRSLYEAIGGKLEEYYFAVGQNTVYMISQIPDEVTVEALVMAVMAGGSVTSVKVTALLTAAEAVEAMRKAASVAYKPPSS
jgi:uncharacterized protein with GYD domain